MSGGEPGRLVEKEELRVPVGGHDHPMPPIELKPAEQPPLDLPRPPDPTLLVVESAPVAHQGASLGNGDDLS